MKIIKPSIEILTPLDKEYVYKFIERCGRVCYKSEDKITPDSAVKFINMVMKNGHESVIEHFNITVRVICDRGVSHEIVRHRIGSYSQESTRFCNYSQDKHGNELTFIEPCFWNETKKWMNNGYSSYEVESDAPVKRNNWKVAMQSAENIYLELIKLGATPQEARSVLPNSLKTEIVITYNLRQWRNFFKLRCSPKAHPQMREVARMIWKEFSSEMPELFFTEDIVNLAEVEI